MPSLGELLPTFESLKENSPRAELEHLVDVALLEGFIGAPIVQVLPLPEGKLNTSFRLRTTGPEFVVKIFRDLSFIHPELDADARATTEYGVMRLCHGNNLGSPRPVALVENTLVMTYLSGSKVVQLPLKRRYVSALTEWLYKFHQIPVPSNFRGLGPLNTPLVGSRYYLDNFPYNDYDDGETSRISEISTFHLQLSGTVTDFAVPLRGDPTLGNWLLCEGVLCGFDFEFSSMGHPAFDLGLLCASILDHGEFQDHAYQLAHFAFYQYNTLCEKHDTRPLSSGDLKLGLLTALVLIAANARDPARRGRLLGNIIPSMSWMEET